MVCFSLYIIPTMNAYCYTVFELSDFLKMHSNTANDKQTYTYGPMIHVLPENHLPVYYFLKKHKPLMFIAFSFVVFPNCFVVMTQKSAQEAAYNLRNLATNIVNHIEDGSFLISAGGQLYDAEYEDGIGSVVCAKGQIHRENEAMCCK